MARLLSFDYLRNFVNKAVIAVAGGFLIIPILLKNPLLAAMISTRLGGATSRPRLSGGSTEELHRDLKVGPHHKVWTKG